MIIVTGGAGFIGSNLIKLLLNRHKKEVIVVDDLSDGHKFFNLVGLDIADYHDKDDFLLKVEQNQLNVDIECIFHMGACSTTTEWDGRFMMRNNYEYSKVLFQFAKTHNIPFIYASSAAVYGNSEVFEESKDYEKPINVYGYSKLLFDNYIRHQTYNNQVAGFRFFNVYGPNEQHKGSMASVAYNHFKQLEKGNTVKLFGAYDGYQGGEQQRDFVYVEDVVDIMLWFMENPAHSGIFNLGTGQARSFNDLANSVIQAKGFGEIEYIDFPLHLKNSYQSFTQANLSQLKATGCPLEFTPLEQGIKRYLAHV